MITWATGPGGGAAPEPAARGGAASGGGGKTFPAWPGDGRWRARRHAFRLPVKLEGTRQRWIPANGSGASGCCCRGTGAGQAGRGDPYTHAGEALFQVCHQLVATLVALVAVLRDHPVHDAAGLLVHFLVEGRDVGRLLVEDFAQQRQRAVRLERHRPAQDLVVGHAQRVDVGPPVYRLCHALLGREVAGCADEHPGGGQPGGGVLREGKPEVGDLDEPTLVHEEVRRLDVAVEKTPVVRCGEAVCRLQHVLCRSRVVDPALLLHHGEQATCPFTYSMTK